MNTNLLLAKGIKLEYATLVWNVISCIPLIIFSRQQNSLALFGFGIDSVIEILASVIVIWQLKAAYNKRDEELAIKCIGVSFILLSVYIIIQAWLNFTSSSIPKPTIISIIWLMITALVMFSLANGKNRIGKKINNPVLLAESKVTVIDGLLAVSVLIGLVFVKYFGWKWMDTISSFVIVFYGMKEAIHAFKSINSNH